MFNSIDGPHAVTAGLGVAEHNPCLTTPLAPYRQISGKGINVVNSLNSTI